jgi:hypothetical protein
MRLTPEGIERNEEFDQVAGLNPEESMADGQENSRSLLSRRWRACRATEGLTVARRARNLPRCFDDHEHDYDDGHEGGASPFLAFVGLPLAGRPSHSRANGTPTSGGPTGQKPKFAQNCDAPARGSAPQRDYVFFAHPAGLAVVEGQADPAIEERLILDRCAAGGERRGLLSGVCFRGN